MPWFLLVLSLAGGLDWRPHNAVIDSALPPDAMATCIGDRMRRFGKVETDRKDMSTVEVTFTFKPFGMPTIAKGRILFSIAAAGAGSLTTMQYTHPMDAKSVSKQASKIAEACAAPRG